MFLWLPALSGLNRWPVGVAGTSILVRSVKTDGA